MGDGRHSAIGFLRRNRVVCGYGYVIKTTKASPNLLLPESAPGGGRLD